MVVEQLNMQLRDFDSLQDTNFLFNSYLKSYRGALANKKISNSVYFKNGQKILANYIQSVGAKIVVACDPEDKNSIFGYMLFNVERNEIFFAYVKEPFRRLGVFKTMLLESKLDVTKPVVCRHDTYGMGQVASALKNIVFSYVPFYFEV